MQSIFVVVIALVGLLLALLLPVRAFVVASIAALLATVVYFLSQTGVEAQAYGLFLGLPIVSIVYGAGSAVGFVLRALAGDRERTRFVLAAVALACGALVVIAQVRSQRAEAEWTAEATTAVHELVAHDPAVLKAVLRVDGVILISTTRSFPPTALEFSVSGPASGAVVRVAITGTRERPQYSVLFVKSN